MNALDRLAELVDPAVGRFGWAVLLYFVIVNGFYLILLLSASWELREHGFEVAGESRHRVLSSRVAPRITMLVPAYNEAATIVESVQALMTLAYLDLEVIVVDDGSSDDTLGELTRAFDLVPIHPIYRRRIDTESVSAIYRSRRAKGLTVARKDNGGKADSLNAALNLASGELVCALDADTLVEEDALQRLVRPFLRSDDIVAAGATIRVANDARVHRGRIVRAAAPHHALEGIQAVEYLRAFLFGRVGWNRLGSNLVISGAFGLFRREALVEAGGYANTIGEDMEIIIRLRRQGYETGQPHRVEFVPDPLAWTEVPSSMRVLGRQRDRWHRGLSDSLWRHRRVFLNPRYGVLGMVVFPAFVVIEWLAPIVEALGIFFLLVGLIGGNLDASFAVLFFTAAYGLGLLMSTYALLLEELTFRRYGSAGDRARLLGWALLENLGYRQITVWWRLKGIVRFLQGDHDWGEMERQGFRSSDSAAQSSI